MRTRDEYRGDIDGLRAIAILAVVAFHASPPTLPGGFAGVDVFFVISGFLITQIVLRSIASGTFSFAAFYARRIRRIFPALIVVLVAALAVGWWLLLPLRYASLGKHVVGGAGFVSNFVVWSEAGYFDAATSEKPLMHLWSLGIEEQFYLVWPLLCWFASRSRIATTWLMAIVTAASFATCAILTTQHPDAAFYLPISRMWELGLGGLLACGQLELRVRLRAAFALVGLALIVAAVLLLDGQSAYPGWRALLPTVGTSLVILGGPATLVNRLLATRLLVWIGLVSYPLYLWHWLLLSFGYAGRNHAPPVEVRLGLVAASVALAVITYRLVERPIRSRRATATQAVALVTLLVLVASSARIIDGLDGIPARFPGAARALLEYRYDHTSDAHYGECWLKTSDPAEGFRSTCLPSPADPRPTIFIWGDSHAGRLRPGIEAVVEKRFFIASATRDSCPPSPLAATESCRAGNRFVVAAIDASKPAVVVVFAHWLAYPATTIDSVRETSAQLIATGVGRVIIVGPAPEWTQALASVVYRAWSDGAYLAPFPRRLRTDLDDRAFSIDRHMAAVAWPTGVEYVSMIDLLCNPEGCLTFAPGSTTDLMTYDDAHLTTAGAIVVARGLHLAR